MNRAWTPGELETLTELYPDHTAKAISLVLDRSVAAIYGQAAQLGLKKSATFLASPASGRLDGTRGASGRFAKGHVPANKGARRPGWSPGRMTETQFRKGQSPHNTQPIGSYRLDKDGTLQRKINNNRGSNSVRWRGVHELVWVEANGPVPPKHIVVFKPGMRTAVLEDITLDKVECISLADNMRRNTLHRYPKEIALAIQMRGALNRRINNVEKQNNR
jgi:hypothetical protein